MVVVAVVIDVVKEFSSMELYKYVLTGRGFATDHNRSWNKRLARILFNAVVEGDDVKNVEELPLVLVNSFYLNIEQMSRVDFDVMILLQIDRQLIFFLLFDLGHVLMGESYEQINKSTMLDNMTTTMNDY